MSLFDSASLVLTPSGYKEDKLYSIKPTDGSGDLVVTRATTATRVNSDGLIEQVPYNFVNYSQDFLTGWATNASPTITANASTAPDGTTTADNFLTSASASGVYQVPTVSSGVTYTFSVYIKNISNATNIRIGCDLNPSTGFVDYNAVTNTIYSTGGAIISSSVESVGNGWYRIKGSYNSTGTQNTLIIFSISSSTFNYSVWGAQLVSGSSAKEYFPTTDRLDVPRLDYTNSTCPSILVEPQRTNLLIYSNDFVSYWIDDGTTTKTANSGISPDGTQNATKMVGTGYGYRFTPTLSVGNHTFSIYFKASANSSIDISVNDFGGSGQTSKSISVTTNWQRFDITKSITLGTTVILSFSGLDAGIDYYVYGAQLEQGSYATSYVPTQASSVTRNADVISKTGISSLIGQTEGTLFVDVILGNENAEMYLILQNILGNVIEDSIYIQRNTNELKFVGWDGYDLNWNISGGSFTTGQRVKIAAAYKANDVVLYVNGTQIGTDSVATIPPTTSLALGYFPYTPSSEAERAKNINSAILWKTRLSNTELANLTTI